VTPRLLALIRAEAHLIGRLEKLEPRLGDGDSASWLEYASLAAALAAIVPQLSPSVVASVLTQADLAERLGCSTRTIRRRVKSGTLPTKGGR
jgi:hypothetical protein